MVLPKPLVMLCMALALANLASAQCSSVRSINGTCNNPSAPNRGATGNLLLHILDSNYPSDWLANVLEPNARELSNLVSYYGSNALRPNGQGVSMVEVFFGQFVNHDRQLTKSRAGPTDPLFNVPMPTNDPFYVAPDNGRNFVGVRDSFTVEADQGEGAERQLPSEATSFLDLSALYGNTDEVAAAMRAFEGGRLLNSTQFVKFPFPGAPTIPIPNMLPNLVQTGLNPDPPLFVPNFVSPGIDLKVLTAGDARVNENIGLALITTLFFREHNRLAAEIVAANPSISDEDAFQRARKLNIAQYQHIITAEYLPALLGQHATEMVPAYAGYKNNIDPTVSIEFAVGALRYGHSAIRNYPFLTPNGCPVPLFIPCGIFLDLVCPPFAPGVVVFEFPAAGQVGGTITVPDVILFAGGLDNVWRGLVNTKAEEVDTYIHASLRDLRFAQTVGNVLDLSVVDTMRGRFAGLPTYYELRKAFFSYGSFNNRADRDLYKLKDCTATENSPAPDPIECFMFTADADVAAKLRDFYGKVTKIEGFIGLLAEAHGDTDAFVPRTVGNIIAQEYVRARDGDRFWYEADGVLIGQEMSSVRASSLAKVIRDNFPTVSVPDNAFKVPDTPLVCTP